jgi:hypothetical protein
LFSDESSIPSEKEKKNFSIVSHVIVHHSSNKLLEKRMHPAQPENYFSKNNQMKIESPFLFSGVFVQPFRIANDRGHPALFKIQQWNEEDSRDLIGVTLGVFIGETSMCQRAKITIHTINFDRLVLSHNKTVPVL